MDVSVSRLNSSKNSDENLLNYSRYVNNAGGTNFAY
jgi:hypothetical protein